MAAASPNNNGQTATAKKMSNNKRKLVEAKAESKPKSNKQLFSAQKRTFGLGEKRVRKAIKKAVKFPRYVRLQRRVKTIKQRLAVPPALHQFKNYCDAPTRRSLAEFLRKNAPETKKEKIIRIRSAVERKQTKPAAAKSCVRYGVQEVSRLVSQGKAKLCIIAANVDRPLVTLPLPSLCMHNNVPYMIVSDKGWLGQFVHQKNVSSIAITEPPVEFKTLLANLASNAKVNYNDQYLKTRTQYGDAQLSNRAMNALQKKDNIINAEKEKAEKLKL